jgi:deoxyribonuclease-4
MRRLGVHTSIAGGLHRALLRAHALGCTTAQIFSHNPRGWKARDITPEERMLFNRYRVRLDIAPVYVHASYLINIASPSERLRKKSTAMLMEEMRRAGELGADFVVLHTGSAHDGRGRERAIRSIVEALEGRGRGTGLLIENTSGKKGDIASGISEMAEIVEGAGVAGICIDTCHAFAAGYDLTTPEERDRLIREIKVLIGLDMVKLIHLNDSRGEMGSGSDRHEHIGRGRIGAEALGLLMLHEGLKGVPVVLETPRESDSEDIENLGRVREMLREDR